MTKPLVVDLFCGTGGWTKGFLAEGWRARGYDIEEHVYGDERYPGEFVLRDLLQMHGSEVADADVIVSSSPCTEYSYMAMPWRLAKAKAAAIRADETGEALRKLNELFDAQFRIQREASEAAGRYIPMVVENVKGAQWWVGRSRWNFGSYHLWGDVPALMPSVKRMRMKTHQGEQWNVNRENYTGVMGWDEDAGTKVPGFRFDGSGKSFQTAAVNDSIKNAGGSWFNIGSPGQKEVNRIPVHALTAEGIKNKDADGYERSHPAAFGWKAPRTTSKGSARKAATAKISEIPFALSSHIARVYKPWVER